MFSRKKKAPPHPIHTPPPPPPPPPPGPPPAIPNVRPHERNYSAATTTTLSSPAPAKDTPLVSPLQMTFDFEIPHRSPLSVSSKPSLESLQRPQTSDGLASSKKNNTRLAPPLLPPIPRVASRHEKAKSAISCESGGSDSEGHPRNKQQRDDSDNVSISSKKSGKSTRSNKSFKIFEMTIDELNKAPALPVPSRPLSSGVDMRPSTAGSMPKMEGTLFPKADMPVLPPLRTKTSGITMDRSFIDSRDKPFQPAKAPAPQLQASSSTPDLSSMLKNTPNFSQKSPLSPMSPPSATSTASAPMSRPGIGSTTSSPVLLQNTLSQPDLKKKRSPSNLSGTTAPSKSSGKVIDEPLTPTIGTPYQETSMSFPLPQHVATRPKTSAGPDSTISGISVPTHHTSSQPSSRPETAKSEKRKTRFLNPASLFTRRKSAQDDVVAQKEKAAQDLALQRQKNVAVAGVKKLPDDFDPRIKGKVIHDFSAPRGGNRQSGRSFTFNDAAEGLKSHQSKLQTANSAPMIPMLPQDGPDVRQSMFSGHSSISANSRRSVHAPVFFEHLSETPGTSTRINAERLENRDFLQRASHVSHASQESAVLPPFARRSQVLDPTQASFLLDDSNKRSSDPSSSSSGNTTANNRESGTSSLSSVSPITARNSIMPPDPARHSMSPISPTSPSKGYVVGSRPKSMALSLLRDSTVLSIDEQDELQQDRPRSRHGLPTLEQVPVPPPNRSAPLPPPIATSPPALASPASGPNFANASVPNGRDSFAKSAQTSKSPPTSPPTKFVEKRASAAGHSKRFSAGAKPKHQVSNASRFSFQLGGSAREELALEEKARKMRSGGGGVTAVQRNGGNRSGEDEMEDDYFDEDAMNDLDEMEMYEEGGNDYDDGFGAQMAMKKSSLPASCLPPNVAIPPRDWSVAPGQPSPGIMSVQDARLQLMVSESDGEDNEGVEDEESASEGGYYDHQDFVDYATSQHSRGHSLTSFKPGASQASSPVLLRDGGFAAQQQERQQQHQRVLSDVQSVLTVNTNFSPEMRGNAAFVQDGLSPHDSVPGGVGGAKPRSGFYMQPSAAGYAPSPTGEKPQGAARDSGSGHENSATAPMLPEGKGQHKSVTSHSTISSGESNKRPFSDATIGAGSSSRSSDPRTGSTGLGLSGFSDFRFEDSPVNSRPVSHVFANGNRVMGNNSEPTPQQTPWLTQHRKRGSSPLIPSGLAGSDERGEKGRSAVARKSSLFESFGAGGDVADDDMYFDGGGFEGDLQTGERDLGGGTDETMFDDERLKRGKPIQDFAPGAQSPGLNGFKAPDVYAGHQRDASAMTVASLGSDGPYPSFAMPNPVKAKQRDSRMMLEDLVLQNPVDPRYIPQRNPSEDAKRLGLSSKVPPLPPQQGTMAAVDSKLQAYHAALAEAANRAAGEGRFTRMPSVSTIDTTRSASVYSKAAPAENNGENAGQYEQLMPNYGNSMLQQSEHQKDLLRSNTGQTMSTLDSGLNQNTTYTPPKMSFDFGFDTAPFMDSTFPSSNDHGTSNALPTDAIPTDAYAPSDAFDDTNDLDGFELDDDDIVAAANAEALASDDDGFYGQEFGFFARARSNSGDGVQAFNGGFFGEDGDDGLARQKSLREPNLTPITERSEFSTRNSFIGGAMFGPPSAGGWGAPSPALARLPVSPLGEGHGDVATFEQLRRLRVSAFGGSQASLGSSGGGSAGGQGYFGGGGSPMAWGYSADSTASAPGSGFPQQRLSGFHDSPASAGSDRSSLPFQQHSATNSISNANDFATPKKAPTAEREASPVTARKAVRHSRQSSGADSVTYVRESDPEDPKGQPRWVLERRRTSELGLTELVGREVVQGGWI